MISNTQKHELSAYFSGQPVDAVYLFGSQATGKGNKLSDIDVAVLFSEGLDDRQRFDLRLSMMSDVGKISHFYDNAEVVDLDNVPLALQYQAIAPRQELFVKNRTRQVLFEARVMSKFFDYVYFIKTNTSVGLAAIIR
ncbi:hypothetical protein A3D03_00890 [Candidatus Gottesmanbacteria bacterium RIFCSPHIGHO2_02_FULL_40_13]|uniref:Polymerase beta nucleotidyltransferase domain-containing protein n=1 Tax=Candidatus Gottesmanbacteria bacterium RIFCSPHIGHO2_02_FULL_40_13 TaxID=1798384 RepID=A0A1F6A7C4_9BACT|nr:MAG: hypothetical protein A3D03_00890 [Candidatus Gottesmanbacteria bacterium RIFCSPHIGHO2_02_FULL_40_13]